MLFLRETRALSSHFGKARPLNLRYTGDSFGGQKHKQVWAGSMTHRCGVRVLKHSCPGMESFGACQGRTLLSSRATCGCTELQRHRQRQEGFQARSSVPWSWPELAQAALVWAG